LVVEQIVQVGRFLAQVAEYLIFDDHYAQAAQA
jgi:hypothetical protein